MSAVRHLVLVGLMGAGKTTIGERCAQRLGRAFLDTDAMIEAMTGTLVTELFAGVGETGFRDFERDAVVNACAAPKPAVISCGGGAVLDPENRRRIRGAGFVVWLDAPSAVLAARVQSSHGRPLLVGSDPETTLTRLRELRLPAYEAVADAIVDSSGTVDEVTDIVISRFETAPAEPA
jgi:shikimate kinase